jgi:hypothetical protein
LEAQAVSEAEAGEDLFEIQLLVPLSVEMEEVGQYFCTGNYVCNSNCP